MCKPAGLALILAACLALPAHADARSSPGRDALARFNTVAGTSDRGISRAELRMLGSRRAADTLFALLDTRGDGRIRLDDVARRGNAALLVRMRAYDIDHDGAVIRREFPVFVDPALFAALDTDRDGRLSLAELRPAFAGNRVAHPRPQPEKRVAAAAAPLPLCWVPVIGTHGPWLQMPVPVAGRCRVQ